MTTLKASLQGERGEALLHGLELLRHTWRDFDASREHQPPISPELEAQFAEPLPTAGTGVSEALDAAAAVLDASLSQSRPRYFGYIGSSGLESAVLADALATSHDVNLAAESAAAYLAEQQTLRWVGELVGFPAASGTFTSGGMVSNLTALMAARTAALPESRLTGITRPCAVYASADVHSSVERAVEILGIGRNQLRDIAIDDRRRMQPEALAEAIRRDKEQGVLPLAVVATGGTTLTGAVDPINAIADICEAEQVWLHVDGAYGLAAASTDRAAGRFLGLARANSASVDAHKWLFVPKACGVVMVRDPAHLQAAFRHEAAYMMEEEGFAHPVDGTLEYSRPFRALKLWTALRAHGAQAFRDAISTNLDLATYLTQRVAADPRLELLLDSPDLTVVPFRRLPSSGDPHEHNLKLARAMQLDGRVYLTSAVIDGRAYQRPCIVNFRTTQADIDAMLEVLHEVGEQLEQES